MTQNLASATVRINQSSRTFEISSEALRKLIKRNGEIEAHPEAAFSHNIRAKLVATNKRLQTAVQANASETSAAE
ncbi:MAG: hypothetical protein JJ897_16655 [Marinibacterium sp.]|nr:hypothetical protein [Marinibacterium sp.]